LVEQKTLTSQGSIRSALHPSPLFLRVKDPASLLILLNQHQKKASNLSETILIQSGLPEPGKVHQL
jgi:hypothetical protein